MRANAGTLATGKPESVSKRFRIAVVEDKRVVGQIRQLEGRKSPRVQFLEEEFLTID